jgi:uncharacterized membrane protein
MRGFSHNRMTPDGRLDHSGLAARRVVIAFGCGLVALVVAKLLGTSIPVAMLVGWIVVALLFLVAVWAMIGWLDADQTARVARAEDSSRPASDLVLIGAGTASLLAVGFTLSEAGKASGDRRAALITLSVAGVVLAWTCVHTVFTLRYARLFHGDPVGGIAFNDDESPTYIDFLYVALTVGMTSQVSDTNLTERQMRRTVIRHALLSYLFGTVVVAMTINIVATLLGH